MRHQEPSRARARARIQSSHTCDGTGTGRDPASRDSQRDEKHAHCAGLGACHLDDLAIRQEAHNNSTPCKRYNGDVVLRLVIDGGCIRRHCATHTRRYNNMRATCECVAGVPCQLLSLMLCARASSLQSPTMMTTTEVRSDQATRQNALPTCSSVLPTGG